jgi:FMN-dependent NADH-azoreductase
MAADVVVLSVPMYNWSIPTQLKAWIDIIVVPGKNFKYGAHGTEGLAGDKCVIVAISRGGFYGAEPPATSVRDESHGRPPLSFGGSAEHAESYMRTVLSFIGIDHPEFVVVEGVACGEESKAMALTSALDSVRQLVT